MVFQALSPFCHFWCGRGRAGRRGVTSQTLLEPVRRFVRNKQLIMIILATVTGAAAAFGAVLFRETVVLIQTGTFGASRKPDECHP